MNKEQKLYLSIGNSFNEAVESQMFGKPCFKVNGKAFVCFFENEMVFKLSGDDHMQALSLTGAHLFDPSGKGRAMKAWVQLPYTHKSKWKNYAESAMEFVKQSS